jgi:spiro-SPASM protein
VDKIAGFSGDAVIDLSLWGELSLHPRKIELINMVLEKPELSLIIETSGIGWKRDELEALAVSAANAAPAGEQISWTAPKAPLSWIVSLDTADSGRYRELRGEGFEEAAETAKILLGLFPTDAYVQAVRFEGAEDDIEAFYRGWKERVPGAENIIIQKYDDFCGALPKKQAADLSPVDRQPCWHLLRDMNILIDGRVPFCREDLSALDGGGKTTGTGGAAGVLGNAFDEALEDIWRRGAGKYREHAARNYSGLCAGCDEYYTFNF